jgi:hypothetical protein
MIQKFIIVLAGLFAAMLCAGVITVAVTGGVGTVAVSGFVVFIIGAFGVVGSLLLMVLFE